MSNGLAKICTVLSLITEEPGGEQITIDKIAFPYLYTTCFYKFFIAIKIIFLSLNIVFSALEYCLNVENINFSAIRTIRVLRPLRAINRIPSKRNVFEYHNSNFYITQTLWLALVINIYGVYYVY